MTVLKVPRLRGMAKVEVRADVISYNSLIHGFSIMAYWQRALDTLECRSVARRNSKNEACR